MPEIKQNNLREEFEKKSVLPSIVYYAGQKWYNPKYGEWLENKIIATNKKKIKEYDCYTPRRAINV